MIFKLRNVFELSEELLKMQIPGSQPWRVCFSPSEEVQGSACVINTASDLSAGVTRPYFDSHGLESVTLIFNK